MDYPFIRIAKWLCSELRSNYEQPQHAPTSYSDHGLTYAANPAAELHYTVVEFTKT